MLHRYGTFARVLCGSALALALGCGDSDDGGLADSAGGTPDTVAGGDAEPGPDAVDSDDAAQGDTAQGDVLGSDDVEQLSDTEESPDALSDTEGSPDTSNDTEAPPDVPVGTDTQPDEEVSGDVNEPPPDVELPPPPALDMERWGQRLIGTPIELSRVGRELWVGTRGNLEPPAFEKIRGGLLRLNLDTGETTLFEDELPLWSYDVGINPVMGPIPAAGVQADLERRVAVVIDGLMVLDAGGWTHVVVKTPTGEPVVPINLGITRDAQHHWAWLSSDKGLLRLNPNTFETLALYGAAQLGAPGPLGKLAIEPETGTVYVGQYADDSAESRVVRVTVSGDVSALTPGDDGTPTGSVGDLLWSAADAAVYVAVGAWDALEGGVLRWDGSTAATVVREGQLSLASSGEVAAFGAQVLALDELHHDLVVGGRIRTSVAGPSKGGGIAVVDLDKANNIAGVSPAELPFPGIHVTAMTYDPETLRTYVVVSGQCSEFKLRNFGLLALSFTDNKPRLRIERPVLSGVRTLFETADGLNAGLRDDNLGLSCDGFPIQSGMATLKSNRAAEVVLFNASSGDGIFPIPGITGADVSPGGEVAISSWKDVLLFGDPKGGLGHNATQSGVSLKANTIRWANDTTVWVGGRTSHSPGDGAALADVGPRGASRLTLDAGSVASFVHFVGAASNNPNDITGLPSSWVTSIIPLEGGGAYVGCGIERIEASVYDRVEDPPFLVGGEPRLGGVARIGTDNSVEVVVDGEHASDVSALALLANGDLLIADAAKGLLVYDGTAVAPFSAPLAAPAGSIPLALWVGSGTDLAVAYNTGVAVRLGDTEGFVGGVGFAWNITHQGSSLLVGTDEGMLQLTPLGVEGIALPAPSPAVGPTFEEVVLPDPDGGECLEAGTPCVGQSLPCCAGLSCGGSGFVLQCQ